MKVFLSKNDERRGLKRGPGSANKITEKESILREIAIMKKLKHPYLIYLAEVGGTTMAILCHIF